MSNSTTEVAVITGGARGIGRAIALGLAATGVDIALVDVAPNSVTTTPYQLSDAERLVTTANEVRALGVRCAEEPADVRNRDAMGVAVQNIERELGPITMLVGAAAVGSVADAGRMTDEEWDDVVDTNLHGFYNTTRMIVPLMVARGHGRVLAIVGDSARRGVAGLSHVAAAGWGVIGLVKSIALEVAPVGVAVNALCTGELSSAFTESDAYQQHATRGGDRSRTKEAALAERNPNNVAWVDEDEVVRAALFILQARGTSMTGSVLDVSNGLSALNTA